MRHYYVSLLKPEIVTSYYGKEWLINQLFFEGETAEAKLKEIVEKQIAYISNPIPIFQIENKIEMIFKNNPHFRKIDEHYFIEVKSFESKAVLNIGQQKIKISASGTYQAETLYFEILRQVDSSFFAMDFSNHNYGWLTPIKQVNYI